MKKIPWFQTQKYLHRKMTKPKQKQGKNHYVQPRGDFFYYVELWDKAQLRDVKLSNIFDEENTTKPSYLAGSQKQFNSQSRLYTALFWKNESSAEFRIELMKLLKISESYVFVIKSLTREEFIESIPEKFKIDNLYVTALWQKNRDLKEREINYKQKIENPWRDMESSLDDMFKKKNG